MTGVQTCALPISKRTLNLLLAKHAGQPLEVIEKGTDRDNFMSAVEAQNFGLIDKVLERMPADQLIARPALD